MTSITDVSAVIFILETTVKIYYRSKKSENNTVLSKSINQFRTDTINIARVVYSRVIDCISSDENTLGISYFLYSDMFLILL